MNAYIRLVSALNEAIGQATALLNLLIIALVCVDVVVRYFLKQTSAFFYEMEWHLFSLLFLLSAGWALRHERHVRVDILYAKLSEKKKALINLLGTLIFLLPFCTVIILTGVPYTISAFVSNEASPDSGGLPFRWVIKSSIVVGAGLLLLQGLALLLESILTLTKKEEGHR